MTVTMWEMDKETGARGTMIIQGCDLCKFVMMLKKPKSQRSHGKQSKFKTMMIKRLSKKKVSKGRLTFLITSYAGTWYMIYMIR